MRGAHPEAAVEQAIRDGAIARGERVLIACSGGPDSVALAAALHAAAKPMALTLRVAHVNHGTRPSAWQDECVAVRIAATLGLPLDVRGFELGRGGETALRDARYLALLEIARTTACSAIAAAHHAEDQSETVLLSLFRGAGAGGMGGMRARRRLDEGIDLVRPLLRVGSGLLRRYCHAHGLPYAVDPTNADTAVRRNAVREALETLRPIFPGLDEAVARAAELTGDELDSVPRAGLRRRVRQELAGEPGLRDVDFRHVEAAVRALERGSSGSFLMKTGIRLEIERGIIAGITKA